MATGSGKTLLMHLNYRQYLHYNREPLDNILLITPSEDLTRQHLEELQASGIPARRFDLNERGLLGAEPDTIRVTEITKLVTDKRGEGVSVPVEAFEGRNLVFVDEGHKGSGSEARAWRSMREALSKRWVYVRVQRDLRPGAERRRRRCLDRRIRQGHRVRLLLLATSTTTATARTSASSICSRRRPGIGRKRCCWATCCRSTSSSASSQTTAPRCGPTTWSGRCGCSWAAA